MDEPDLRAQWAKCETTTDIATSLVRYLNATTENLGAIHLGAEQASPEMVNLYVLRAIADAQRHLDAAMRAAVDQAVLGRGLSHRKTAEAAGVTHRTVSKWIAEPLP